MTRPFILFRMHPIVVRWLRNSPRFWRMLILCLSGGVAILLVTFICFRLRLTLATPALLYLVVIVLLSLYGSFVLSAVFSFIGVACLDYFFTLPVFTFRVDDPFDIVAIFVFLTVGSYH